MAAPKYLVTIRATPAIDYNPEGRWMPTLSEGRISTAVTILSVYNCEVLESSITIESFRDWNWYSQRSKRQGMNPREDIDSIITQGTLKGVSQHPYVHEIAQERFVLCGPA